MQLNILLDKVPLLWVVILVSVAFLISSPSIVTATSMHYAVIADLSRSTFTSNLLQTSIQAYTSNASSSLDLFKDAVPHIINSNGSLLTALSQLELAAKNTPEGFQIVFIGDTLSITEGVSDFIFQNSSQVPIISLLAASDSFCKNYPNVVCVCPTESTVLEGLLEVSYSQFTWLGASAVMLDTLSGRQLGAILADRNAASLSPSITEYFYVSPSMSDFPELSDSKEVGVFTFLPDQEMLSLYSHFINTSTTDNSITSTTSSGANSFADIVSANSSQNSTTTNGTATSSCPRFFIGNYLALNAQQQFPAEGSCAALFIPHYVTPMQLEEQGIISSDGKAQNAKNGSYTTNMNTESTAVLDDTGAYIISYLFDALQMVEHAGGTSSISALRTVNFTGMTGQVVFSVVTLQRLGIKVHLISSNYTVDSPLVSYTLSASGSSQIQNLRPTVVSTLIPSSPLSTVTLCLAIPPNCEDVTQATSIYYYLLYQYFLNSNTTLNLNVKMVNTGNEGVSGYSSFLPIARLCTALLGTGHASIDYAFAPLVNYFNITQIDYQAATTVFSGPKHQTIPSFSRTIPEYSYSDLGFAEICTHFGWERIIVISTSGRYGESRGEEAVAAMVRRNVYVEKNYHLANTTQQAIIDTFNKIYTSDVSRIILLAASFSSQEAEAFFNVIDQATYLSKYVLLLDQTLCAYGNAYPSARNKLQSSICMVPQADSSEVELLNDYISLNNLSEKAKNLLSENGFQTEARTCSYTNVSSSNGFVIDAAAVFFQAVWNANDSGVSLFNSSSLLSFIRGNLFYGVTGDFTIDARGNRDVAYYECNIQTPHKKIVAFGSWSEEQKPSFQSIDVEKWVWMDNSTIVPLDTFRDAAFVFQSTAFSSPEGIAISAIGFIFTVFAFFLCFRHYDIQHKIERNLSSNKIPVTDTELKELCAFRD